jgi:peptide/nickel transport system permease protein
VSAYIIRRLLLMIPTLLLVTIIVFLASRLIPGDVIDQMVVQMGDVRVTKRTVDEIKESIRHELGLDLPMYVQYGRWLGGVLRGDLGNSLWNGVPTGKTLLEKFPVTFELGLLAAVIALIIALPIGIYSAIRQDTVGDYVARSFAIACIALPSFWLGTMVMIYPSRFLAWSPPIGYVSFFKDPIKNLSVMLIPAIILGMVLSGNTMRMTRTMMLEVLRQDYIRTAWSKGLRERAVILRHALKNAFIPVVTIIGLQIPVLIGGSVVIEQIFVMPGVGRFLLETLNHRDYPALSAINLLMASTVLIINLLVDLSYAYLDPRVRYT